MWHSHLTDVGSVTNTVTLPHSGVVGVNKPDNIELSAYLNNVEAPLHHLHVKEGDTLYFKLESHDSLPHTIDISYEDSIHKLYVAPPIKEVAPYNVLAHSEQIKHKESIMMKEDINIFGGSGAGTGGAMGAGLGAGVLGGVLGGVLLNNRNGLLGNGADGGNFVTPTQLQTGLDAVTAQNQTTAILQSLGDIKASVPLAESQVQLALAGAQNDINAQINTSTSNLLANQALIGRDISTNTAAILASQNGVENTVQNGIASVNLGIANLATANLQNTYALNTAIRDDGDKTRALIVAQNDANLQRMLAVAESQLAEQRAIGRSRDIEVNVSQNVNQNQAQLQMQAQQQQQAILLSNIVGTLNGLQNAVATNSNLIVGNTGAVATGAQTANPVNVRA